MGSRSQARSRGFDFGTAAIEDAIARLRAASERGSDADVAFLLSQLQVLFATARPLRAGHLGERAAALADEVRSAILRAAWDMGGPRDGHAAPTPRLSLPPPLAAVRRGEPGTALIRLEDAIAESASDPAALRGRLARVTRWLAEARAPDDGVDDSFPDLDPPATWKPSHVADVVGGVPVIVSGWVEVARDAAMPPEAVGAALVAGYLAERKFVDRRRREVANLRLAMRARGRGPSEADEALAPAEAALAAMVRALAYQEHFRRQVDPSSPDPFGDGRSAASALAPAAPWLDLLPGRDARARPGRRSGWAWEPEAAPRPAGAQPGASPPCDGPPADGGDGRQVDAVAGDLAGRLALPGGEALAGRLARLAVRLDASCPARSQGIRNPESYEDLRYPIAARGEPDPRRARHLSMSPAEHAASFGGAAFEPGSAGDAGFCLPVGAVVVWPDGEAPYLRGRGWRISSDRRLFAWDGEPEPHRVLPVGGTDGPPAEGHLPNASPVPRPGYASYRGQRWYNLYGDGPLRDESLFEWHDRKMRVRAQAWARLDASVSGGGPGLSASEWRWVYWSLVGPYFGPLGWRLPPGGWRWPSGYGPEARNSVRQATSFESGPDSAPSEWSDPRHDRKWGGDFLPDRLQGHALVRLLQSREGGSPEPYLEALVACVSESAARMGPPGSDSPRRRAFDALRGRALGGRTFEEFLAHADAKAAFESAGEEEWEDEVAAYRAAMRAACRVAVVPDPQGFGPRDGPGAVLAFEEWRWDFEPEPFLVPGPLSVPEAPGGVGHDFSSDADQGAGVPGRPAGFMDPGFAKRLFLPSGHAQVLRNAAQAGDPVVPRNGPGIVSPCGRDCLPPSPGDGPHAADEAGCYRQLRDLLFGQGAGG